MAADMKKIRGLDEAAMTKALQGLREQLFKLRWQSASGTNENPSKIREVRRDIARHLTVLSERQGSAAESTSGES